MDMKIYISGPLKVLSNREKFHRFYEFLASVCREYGHEPYMPHQKSDPVFHKDLPYKQVFQMDIDNLLNSKKILAVIDEPSTGVGAEIGIALEKGINVIAVYHHQSEPSRFILGLLERSPHATIIQYNDELDCGEKIRPLIEKKIELI